MILSDVIWALLLGVAVGVVFGIFRMVPPAPPTFAGIAGIVGIFLGWLIVSGIMDRIWPPEG